MQWSAISFTLTRFFISLLKLLAISHYLSWLRASVAQTGKFLATVYPKFYTSKTKVIVSIQAASNATFEVNCFSRCRICIIWSAKWLYYGTNIAFCQDLFRTNFSAGDTFVVNGFPLSAELCLSPEKTDTRGGD